MNDRCGRASTGRSRTNSQNTTTAVNPGTSVHKKTCRYECRVCSSSHNAVSGPAIAPTVSISRSNPKRAPVCARRNVCREQRFFRRRSHAAPKPCKRSPQHHFTRCRRESERRRRKRRHRVAEHRQRLPRLQSIREMSGRELRETRKPVGDAFDHAKPRRPRTDQREKCGQHRGRGFVAPVAEETRQGRITLPDS